MDTKEALPKIVKMTVIYPCWIVPNDSDKPISCKYGDQVTVGRDEAKELIGYKRAVLTSEFSKEKFPPPMNKGARGKNAPKSPDEVKKTVEDKKEEEKKNK